MTTESPEISAGEYQNTEELSEQTLLSVCVNPSKLGRSLMSQSYCISGETTSRQNEQNHSPLRRDIGKLLAQMQWHLKPPPEFTFECSSDSLIDSCAE